MPSWFTPSLPQQTSAVSALLQMQHQSVDEARRTTSSAQSKYHALQNIPPPPRNFFGVFQKSCIAFFRFFLVLHYPWFRVMCAFVL